MRIACRMLVLFIVVLLGSSASSACQSHYTRQFEKGDSNYGSRTGKEQAIRDDHRGAGVGARSAGHHRNKSVRYDPAMSAVVSDMPGIFSAIVMVTDQNAYAAAILDSTGTGIAGKGKRVRGDHVGTTRGMYNWKSGGQYVDPNEIAGDHNAYFTIDDHRDISELLKRRVAREIRKLNPGLKDVYFSANRDFINQMSVYREEERRGVDLNGYLSDFNKLVGEQFEA